MALRDEEDLSARGGLQRDISGVSGLLSGELEQLLADYDDPAKKPAAVNRLFEANLLLVMSIVSKRAIQHGITDEQQRNALKSVGMTALWIALPKYDPHRLNDKGEPNKISTYVFDWIDRAVRLEIRNYHLMMRGQDPTQPVLSLDMPTGEEDDGSFYDILADDHVEEPSLTQDQDVADVLRKLWQELGGDQAALVTVRQIAELRYGLRDNMPRTLKEVGKQFGKTGLTRESIRQREILFKEMMLKHPTLIDWLRSRVEE